MKSINSIWIIILFIIGCGGCKQSDKQSDKLNIDVTAKYQKKELILQDFMDVEYIALETEDDFICQGFIQAIGKEIIIVKNFIDDGNIFIFNRSGRGVRKINRKGQGNEEYIAILGIVLDEDNNEIFVNDAAARRILVYDLEGTFKRSFKLKDRVAYNAIFNFDRNNLICHDSFLSGDDLGNKQTFMIISKQDGSISKEIQIPFEEKIPIWLRLKDETNGINGINYYSTPSTYYPIIPYLDNWILVESSSDTIYRYSTNHTMRPFIVRTPLIQSMNPEIFLFLSILTDRYYFMETIKKEWDFKAQSGFPNTNLMYDIQERTIYRYFVRNDDYSNSTQVFMNSRPVNNEIATWQKLDAHTLVNAHAKGQLKGKLKEIAATLDEDSNPVIMLIKHKK